MPQYLFIKKSSVQKLKKSVPVCSSLSISISNSQTLTVSQSVRLAVCLPLSLSENNRWDAAVLDTSSHHDMLTKFRPGKSSQTFCWDHGTVLIAGFQVLREGDMALATVMTLCPPQVLMLCLSL